MTWGRRIIFRCLATSTLSIPPASYPTSPLPPGQTTRRNNTNNTSTSQDHATTGPDVSASSSPASSPCASSDRTTTASSFWRYTSNSTSPSSPRSGIMLSVTVTAVLSCGARDKGGQGGELQGKEAKNRWEGFSRYGIHGIHGKCCVSSELRRDVPSAADGRVCCASRWSHMRVFLACGEKTPPGLQ